MRTEALVILSPRKQANARLAPTTANRRPPSSEERRIPAITPSHWIPLAEILRRKSTVMPVANRPFGLP